MNIQLSMQCVKGASKSSSVGIVYVSTSSSCYIETFLPRNKEIAHNCKEGERYVAKGKEVSFPVFCSYFLSFIND